MKLKKIFFRVIVSFMVFCTVCINSSVYAQDIEKTNDNSNVNLQKELTPLSEMEIVIIDENYSELPMVPNNALSSRALSATKTKTKTLYSASTSKKVGTITLKYKTQNVGGRPQFVYSQSKIGWNITAPGYLPGGNPVINFSGDLIKVIMPLNLYGLPDKGTVSFTP